MSGKRIKYKTLRLVELADDSGEIEGVHFRECTVLGPAILLPQGDTFDLIGNTIPGSPDAWLWEIPPERKRVMGVIVSRDCSFRDCTLKNVGIAGHPDFIARIREGIRVE